MLEAIRAPLLRGEGRLSQAFGVNAWLYDEYGLAGHPGLDWGVVEGTPVFAAHAGRVRRGDFGANGRHLYVTGAGVQTLYAHLSGWCVAADAAVVAGQQIGLSGNTGRSSAPHLHFGVRPLPYDAANGYGGYIDPAPLLAANEPRRTMMRQVVGWHLGNDCRVNGIDWEIMRRVPPGNVVFLTGQQVGVDDVRAILALNPTCHFFLRPYLDPGRIGTPAARDYGVLPGYIEEVVATLDGWTDVIPAGQRHVLVFNEQNMPAWCEAWEGFGDQLADMETFDHWFTRAYDRIHGVYGDAWRVAWTPLTPGNRDVWFEGDAVGHYYLHGPAGCAALPDVRAAIQGGPCLRSLMRADEFACHVYIHEGRGAFAEAWRGLRFARMSKFFPKTMGVWITEAGFPGLPEWGGDALIDWLRELRGYPMVQGLSLWMLGDNPRWGRVWYDGDKPRREVDQLAEWLAAQDDAGDEAPAPPAGGGEVVVDDVQEAIRRAVWRLPHDGVDYQPAWAFPAFARGAGLGAPETVEVRVTVNGVRYAAQGYARGIVYAVDGDWGNVMDMAW